MSLLCLQCPLPDCNEQSDKCLVQIEKRKSNLAAVQKYQEKKKREIKARIQRKQYAKDPAKKIQQVREWQKANREKLNAYQREYDAKKRRKRNESNPRPALDTDGRLRRVADYLDGDGCSHALARLEKL